MTNSSTTSSLVSVCHSCLFFRSNRLEQAKRLPMFPSPFSSSYCSSSSSSSSCISFLSQSILIIPCWTRLQTPKAAHEVRREVIRSGLRPRLGFAPVLGLRPAESLLVRCSHLDSQPNHLQNEIGLLYSFFAGIGIDEKESQLLLEQNPCLLLSTTLGQVHRRVFLLQSAGIEGVELYRMIMKRPSVLTEEEIDPFLEFVLHGFPGKIDPAQLKRILTATGSCFLVGFDQKVDLLLRRGVPHEKIVHVLNNVNVVKALCLRSVQEVDRTVTFLSRFGGIEIIVRRPLILNFDLETQLIPRVEFLKELSGGDEDATGILLRKLPAILSYSVEHTRDHVELLRSFAGLNDQQIFKIFLVFPNVVSASKERKLRPRIGFLKQCGLNSDEIFKFLTKAPLFLGLSFEDNLVHKLVFLVKIGYKHRTKELTLGMGAMTRTSCENLQKVIGLFLSYGLSCADILTMSKKHPQILQYSHGSLEEKLDYFTGEMGRDMEELLAFPAFLGYNLDDRIKRRYKVKKETRGEGLSINKLLTVSSDRFSTGEVKEVDVAR